MGYGSNQMEEAQSKVDLTIEQAKDLANSLLKQGRLGEAKALVHQLLSARPMDAEITLLAAKCEFHSGHPTVARSLVFKAWHSAPDIANVKVALAELETLDRSLASNEYRNSFLILRNRHRDYPMNIQLETVGSCNAKCIFCPHDELDRKLEAMSDDLFEKIVNDATAIPSSSPLNFFMNVVNEPFMDKKIFSRMRMLNEKISHATIGIYTNMNVVPAAFFEKLREIKQVTSWNISFNAANKDEYEKTMGIDFDRSVANIKRFIGENRKRKFVEGSVYLSRVATEDEADKRFMDECKSLFAEYQCNDDFFPVCKNRAEWLGHVSVGGRKRQILMPCNQWFNISIHCNGLVPHCCMDAKGEFSFGDINKQSVLEIYNSPNFRNFRENVISRDVIYPCNTCSLF